MAAPTPEEYELYNMYQQNVDKITAHVNSLSNEEIKRELGLSPSSSWGSFVKGVEHTVGARSKSQNASDHKEQLLEKLHKELRENAKPATLRAYIKVDFYKHPPAADPVPNFDPTLQYSYNRVGGRRTRRRKSRKSQKSRKARKSRRSRR
jgi:hypothetical protein